ncbi:hypothetical protein CSA56_06240 [candidate division KSB3 bacterium]|uniref:Carbamoyltransferase n=1 Tax=candidate division KSB3 bacterium TaxID=2044937 RepID=A0A2G6KGX7_9BACT|nr:MAG: hypothetical protein CSA56_06240 [candidate division KSB3 bacterium]
MNILGLRIGHDASAALIVDGKIIADVAEERFSRIKNDGSFPLRSVQYCLEAGGITAKELDGIATPSRSFVEHLFIFFGFPAVFETIRFSTVAPPTKKQEMPVKKPSLFQKLFETPPQEESLEEESQEVRIFVSSQQERFREPYKASWVPELPFYQKPFALAAHCKLYLVEHHIAHAASACFTSGLNNGKALCVTMDGIGEGISNAVWRFENNRLQCLATYDGKTSLGWFYAASTEAIGWRQSRDEWKMMGLAPFGKPHPGALQGFYPQFKDGDCIEPHNFGDFGRWNDHGANHYHCGDAKELAPIAQALGHENFAAEVQRVSEKQAMNFILPWLEREQCRNLFCAGGFFLNVKFNQKIWYTGKLDRHWVYPNSGDPGLSVGAGLMAFYHEHPEQPNASLEDLYKGPEFSDAEIEQILDDRLISYTVHDNIAEKAAELLEKNYVLGWFQGRMEAGPRALGNRSILMSPLHEENRDIINKKIKYRETFRPFCPSMLHEKAGEYLVNPRDALYMVISFDAQPGAKQRIPAVIHVDETARPHMVKRETNPVYYDLIQAFGDRTGEYVILNTSFNVKGEPIVCTPREAIKCFYDTGMDALILGNYVIEKAALPK